MVSNGNACWWLWSVFVDFFLAFSSWNFTGTSLPQNLWSHFELQLLQLSRTSRSFSQKFDNALEDPKQPSISPEHMPLSSPQLLAYCRAAAENFQTIRSNPRQLKPSKANSIAKLLRPRRKRIAGISNNFNQTITQSFSSFSRDDRLCLSPAIGSRSFSIHLVQIQAPIISNSNLNFLG